MSQLTTIPQKLLASISNALLALIITTPFGIYYSFDIKWKLITIIIFLVYELSLLVTKSRRDIGMLLVSSHWKMPFTNSQYIIYNILYTLSFATLFFHIIFPGDLLLLNLLFIQIPYIIYTKSTLHGYLSGMATISERGNKV